MTALPRKVLALGAHPDDLELLRGGTLARFVAAGSVVEMAIACRGDRGGASGPSDALAATRREEALEAAEILRAPVHFLELGDSELADTPDQRRLVLELLRTVRPDLVITHSPTDYHDDHVRLCDLAAKVTWFAASPGHVTPQPPLERPPALVYMDNVAGVAFEPTHFVDITSTIDIKRRMLVCHASQLERSDSGISGLEELAETLARLRGFQCGTRYAEAFRPALLWGRCRPEPLLP